ncbi:hypothetical protein [Microbacterium sp. 77mftsu3.1]|uniref:hypothetical protein n=1 Tax=Microbacterium sp. 77mftsu3.1 TaxID=1761802 RepID=UPI00036A94EE|nr:hypothetical protein [Microbacterium sp. 77mftsu3.1]SDH51021.1 hypothetical protein SAMN04488590_3482 [Microbacterium sp. 77mftsu3.1]
MANPFLVLGGIAVGIITAAFGVLAVPGWVASAQDASAKNDIAQVTIGQAASLSATGFVKSAVQAPAGASPTVLADTINGDAAVGVSVTTGKTASIFRSTDKKNYIVIVESDSNKAFWRLNGGAINEAASRTAAVSAANAAAIAAYPGATAPADRPATAS